MSDGVLFALTALFRRIAIGIAEHLGYEHPHTLDDGVTRYLRNVWEME